MPKKKSAKKSSRSPRREKAAAKAKVKSWPKQQLFAYEFCANGFNGQAAIDSAGYAFTSNNAKSVAAHKLLQKPRVAQYVSDFIEAKLFAAGIRADRYLSELAAVAFTPISSLIVWDQNGARLRNMDAIDPVAMASIASVKSKRRQVFGAGEDEPPIEEIEVELKQHNKHESLKMIGEYLEVLARAQAVNAEKGDAKPAPELAGAQGFVAYFPEKMEPQEWLNTYAARAANGGSPVGVHPHAPRHLQPSTNGHKNGKAKTNGKSSGRPSPAPRQRS